MIDFAVIVLAAGYAILCIISMKHGREIREIKRRLRWYSNV